MKILQNEKIKLFDAWIMKLIKVMNIKMKNIIVIYMKIIMLIISFLIKEIKNC